MILSCDGITQEKFFDYVFDSVSINNFFIKNDDGPVINVPGETYLFQTHSAFGHSLMDIYGQFKILQLKYKNIKPFFYETQNGYFNQNKVTIDQMYFLGYKNPEVFNISVGNYSFEKVIMFFDMNLTFPQEFYSSNGATRSLQYFPFCDCPVGGGNGQFQDKDLITFVNGKLNFIQIKIFYLRKIKEISGLLNGDTAKKKTLYKRNLKIMDGKLFIQKIIV